MKYAHIVGWGSYWPEKILTNEEIAQKVDTSHEWIYSRTGIKERRIANVRETTTQMAFRAAVRALEVANIPPSQVDLVIVATSTPEYVFPAAACQVQDLLGASRAGAFDLSVACSGFIYGLSMAASAIACGSINTALVIGAETLSRIVDWTDRGTCILFGDGAGAVVLKGSSVPGGVLSTTLGSDGSGGELLYLKAAGARPVPPVGAGFSPNGYHPDYISMNGREVFRFATRVMAESVQDVLQKAEMTMADVSLIVPHQANARIIETAAKRLKVSSDLFYVNLERAGNTSTASIPLALCEAVEAGRLKPDDNVVFVGFGGGLSWGAALIKWDVTPPEPREESAWRRSPWYLWARSRSALRRLVRKIIANLAGSPTPEARLRDAEKRKRKAENRRPQD